MFEPDVVTLIVLPWLFGATSLRMPALNVTLVTPARSWRASSGSIGRCQDAGAASGALAGLRVETNFENERVATEETADARTHVARNPPETTRRAITILR